mgnify:CR=1 FL=1
MVRTSLIFISIFSLIYGLVFFLTPGIFADLTLAEHTNIAWLRNIGAAIFGLLFIGLLLVYIKPEKNYDLFINCDFSNSITKKFFQKQIKKNYHSFAFTSIIKHKKIKNNTAIQIFTQKGPFAFLPISNNETSVVYSIRGESQIDLNYFINRYNKNYKIISFGQVKSFNLNSSSLRSYYYKNILAFGDLLHKLHPLAGQGFNMTIRDIREILNLIKLRKNNGLSLDSSICMDFEKNLRHKNIIFSSGVDFIYEFFNLESKMNNQILSRSVKLLGKNKLVNNFFTNIADNGLII